MGSSVVTAPDSWSKGHGFESRQQRRENVLFQGQLSVLTLISLFDPPRVTAVARKKSRSFCQKCRWLVTTKHACTLRIWLCMEWLILVHGCLVHRTRPDGSSFEWHQPCKSQTAQLHMDIQSALKKATLTDLVICDKSAVSARVENSAI